MKHWWVSNLIVDFKHTIKWINVFVERHENPIRSMRLISEWLEEQNNGKKEAHFVCTVNVSRTIFTGNQRNKPPPTASSTPFSIPKKQQKCTPPQKKSSKKQLLTADRPRPSVPSVLRHCLCVDRGGGKRRWGAGEAGGCAAVSLLLMLRESNAAPPETNWMSGGRFSYQQAAQPPNPNTDASPLRCYTQTPELPLGGFFFFFPLSGVSFVWPKWKPN